MQLRCSWLENCIAIQLLYCRLEWLGLCHNTMDCIVTKEGNQAAGLYRNTVHCIVTREQGKWAGLYCNIATAPVTWRRPDAGAAGAQGPAGVGYDAATRPVERPGRGLCAQAGPSWCTVHLTQF